jgi:hypothetical protein
LCECDARIRVWRNTPLCEPAFRGLGLVRSGEIGTSASGAPMKAL